MKLKTPLMNNGVVDKHALNFLLRMWDIEIVIDKSTEVRCVEFTNDDGQDIIEFEWEDTFCINRMLILDKGQGSYVFAEHNIEDI